MRTPYLLIMRLVLAFPLASVPIGSLGAVEKWGRHIVSLSNQSYLGNPFLLEVDATFTHSSSGKTLNLPGYYAGNHTWKIAFMPTLVGEWTYETASADRDLDGVTGSLESVASDRLGLLSAAPSNPRKWKYQDGPLVIPVGVFVQLMLEDASLAQVAMMADFLRSKNVQLVNFRLSENDYAFSSVRGLRMSVKAWDRLEQRMEILASRGIGANIMLYTDDSGKPSYRGGSAAENLLVRYTIARLASFPQVLFNTGIDISEYRTMQQINAYGALARTLDPYDHPISSRHGGGSGRHVMHRQTFNSVGDRNSEISKLLSAYDADDVPSSNDDNWGEQQSGINGHTISDLRRAAWKATIAGGVGFNIRHNQKSCPGNTTECDTPFSIKAIAEDWDSADFVALVNPFIEDVLGSDFQLMEPDQALVGGGRGGKYALADPDREKILILTMGVNDSWDSGDGGSISIDLGGSSGHWDASWFDPRSGERTCHAILAGETPTTTVTPPTSDDWLLLLDKISGGESTICTGNRQSRTTGAH